MNPTIQRPAIRFSELSLLAFLLLFNFCSKPFNDDFVFFNPDNPLFLPGLTAGLTKLNVTVTSSSGSNLMKLTSSVDMTFSEKMDPSTMTVQSADGPCTMNVQFSADPQFTSCIGGTLSGTDTNWTFLPAISLEEESVFYFRITTNVKTRAGPSSVALDSEFQDVFTTEDLPVLSDLVSWYKTNQGIYKSLADGNPVPVWKNAKGLTNDTGVGRFNNPPTYLQTFKNARGALNFNPQNFEFFTTPFPSFTPPIHGNTGYTVFIVFQTNTVNQTQTLFDILINNVFRPRFRLSINSTGALELESRKFDSDNTDLISAGSLTPGTHYIASAYADYSLNEVGVFLEDGSVYSFAENTAPVWDATQGTTCSATVPLNFTIGKNGFSWWWNWRNSTVFDGSISDVILYNKRLSQREREDVVCFLGRKFNIAVSNPSGCP